MSVSQSTECVSTQRRENAHVEKRNLKAYLCCFTIISALIAAGINANEIWNFTQEHISSWKCLNFETLEQEYAKYQTALEEQKHVLQQAKNNERQARIVYENDGSIVNDAFFASTTALKLLAEKNMEQLLKDQRAHIGDSLKAKNKTIKFCQKRFQNRLAKH